MKNNKRALRRHKTRMLKKKRSTYWEDLTEDCLERVNDKRLQGLKLSHPTGSCRNMCCANQRKFYGPTKQELIHFYNPTE